MEGMEDVQGGAIRAATPGVYGGRAEHTGAALRLRPHQVACRAAPVPLYVVDKGRSLREDVKALTSHSGSRNARCYWVGASTTKSMVQMLWDAQWILCSRTVPNQLQMCRW